MHVLVWQSFGDITVIRAESPQDLALIMNRLEVTVRPWGEQFTNSLVACGIFSTTGQIRKALQRWAREQCRDHEAIERLEFVRVQELT